MNEHDKSLALAKLMGWSTSCGRVHCTFEGKYFFGGGVLHPYAKTEEGLAQFSAILLKFPDVVSKFVCTEGHTDEHATSAERYERYGGMFQGFITAEKPFTQEAVLDEVLHMSGVEL